MFGPNEDWLTWTIFMAFALTIMIGIPLAALAGLAYCLVDWLLLVF